VSSEKITPSPYGIHHEDTETRRIKAPCLCGLIFRPTPGRKKLIVAIPKMLDYPRMSDKIQKD
jgi:hypothetical protein